MAKFQWIQQKDTAIEFTDTNEKKKKNDNHNRKLKMKKIHMHIYTLFSKIYMIYQT